MRVLLDACIPERFARFVPGHDVTTMRAFFGTTDVDDGPVLDRITDMFDAFITVDKNLRFQQNLRGRPFRIVLLRTHSNAIENLVPLVPQLLVALSQMQPPPGGHLKLPHLWPPQTPPPRVAGRG